MKYLCYNTITSFRRIYCIHYVFVCIKKCVETLCSVTFLYTILYYINKLIIYF